MFDLIENSASSGNSAAEITHKNLKRSKNKGRKKKPKTKQTQIQTSKQIQEPVQESKPQDVKTNDIFTTPISRQPIPRTVNTKNTENVATIADEAISTDKQAAGDYYFNFGFVIGRK